MDNKKNSATPFNGINNHNPSIQLLWEELLPVGKITHIPSSL
jgi:hypothetical protein